MTIRRIVIFIILMITTGCSTTFDYSDKANYLVSKRAAIVCAEEGLGIDGQGGAMMDDIHLISLKLSIVKAVGIPEARRLIVKVIEGLLLDINNDAEIQPFLNPYPFPPSKMDVSVDFIKIDGSFLEYGCAHLGDGGVSSVSQFKGKLFYSSHNSRTGKLEDYYEESYETALAIVRGELEETVCEPITPTPSSCK